MGLDDNTLYIITSDHGEKFLDHGGMEHGWTLYDEVLHIPLIVRKKSVIPEGVAIENIVQLIDILPSVLDLLNIKLESIMQGKSFIPTIKNSQSKTNDYAFAEMLNRGDQKAIYCNRHKYIKNYANGRDELYDLVNDPYELVNLQNQMSVKAYSFENMLDQFRMRALSDLLKLDLKREEDVGIDNTTMKKLKALGYIK